MEEPFYLMEKLNGLFGQPNNNNNNNIFQCNMYLIIIPLSWGSLMIEWNTISGTE